MLNRFTSGSVEDCHLEKSPRVVWVEDEIRQRHANSRILDVGFVGSYAEPFVHLSIRLQNPGASMVGIDIDISGVVQSRIPNTLVGDAVNLPFADNSFDVVLFLEVLEHIYVLSLVLHELSRVLRSGGEMIVTTPNAWAWWNMMRHWLLGSLSTRKDRDVYRSYLGAPDHKRFVDPLSLMNILDDHDFETVELVTKNHSIPFLSRYCRRFALLDWQFWPINRLGSYICLVARKRGHALRTSRTGNV